MWSEDNTYTLLAEQTSMTTVEIKVEISLSTNIDIDIPSVGTHPKDLCTISETPTQSYQLLLHLQWLECRLCLDDYHLMSSVIHNCTRNLRAFNCAPLQITVPAELAGCLCLLMEVKRRTRDHHLNIQLLSLTCFF